MVRPLPALGPCSVAACTRRAESEHGYCPTHYVRWRQAVTASAGADERHWRLTQPAVSEGGQVSLRGLPPLVVVQVLAGMQQRTLGGAKITDVNLRAVCDALRRQQAASIGACAALSGWRGYVFRWLRSLLDAIVSSAHTPMLRRRLRRTGVGAVVGSSDFRPHASNAALLHELTGSQEHKIGVVAAGTTSRCVLWHRP